MTDFDALLKRSFAEAPEPVDDGFSVHISHAVERRENVLRARNLAQSVGLAAAGAAICYGVYGLVAAFGQDALASAGLEIARLHGAVSGAPTMATTAQGLMQGMSAGMTQILLIMAAVAGGAVAYRATQE